MKKFTPACSTAARRFAYGLTALALAAALAGCDPKIEMPTLPTREEKAPEITATVPPDGDPGTVTCKGSYTVTEGFDRTAAAAKVGSETLTNGQLAVYYRMALNGYQPEPGAPAPDWTQPLDTQLCPLAVTRLILLI